MTPAKIVEVVSHMNGRDDDGDANAPAARRPSRRMSLISRQSGTDCRRSLLEARMARLTSRRPPSPVRYAPFNAIALLVGSQAGRPGVLTQCSLEEATELKLGMLHHTCCAETISVYGTEPVSLPMAMTLHGRKAFPRLLLRRLARPEMRLPPVPVLKYRWAMPKANRCFISKRAASRSARPPGCKAPEWLRQLYRRAAVPSGIRAALAGKPDSLSADLECVSSNDQTFTHRICGVPRVSLMQFLPGTDFISSGYFGGAELRQHVRRFQRRCRRLR